MSTHDEVLDAIDQTLTDYEVGPEREAVAILGHIIAAGMSQGGQ